MAERRESGQGSVKERCDAKKEGAAWDSWSAASGELFVGGERRADSVAILAGVYVLSLGGVYVAVSVLFADLAG